MVQYDDEEEEMAAVTLNKKFSELDQLGEKLVDQHSSNDSIKKNIRHSVHRCIIPAREEEVPQFSKVPKSKTNVKAF